MVNSLVLSSDRRKPNQPSLLQGRYVLLSSGGGVQRHVLFCKQKLDERPDGLSAAKPGGDDYCKPGLRPLHINYAAQLRVLHAGAAACEEREGNCPGALATERITGLETTLAGSRTTVSQNGPQPFGGQPVAHDFCG